MASLSYIGHQITIYSAYFILFIGVLGNGINILVFLNIRTYRTTPCTFYFLTGSIVNLTYLPINLISRIMSVGYGIDFSHTSVVWCKLRQFLFVCLSAMTLTCSCLATIDQYLVTSQNVNLRRLSNMKWAHRITLIVVIIWCLHAIPNLFFYNIIPISDTCVNTNAVYAIYTPIYLIGLLCVIPVLLMVALGCLAYRNIRQTRALVRQHADRQLTKMTFIQVILVIICVVPFGMNNAYGLITSNISKDGNRLLKENFASTIFSALLPFYCAVCLFIYCYIMSQIFFVNYLF
jgi:hypothetical protein